MKVSELFNTDKSTDALEIEASVKELGEKTNKYRELKSLDALKSLQKTQKKIIKKLENNPTENKIWAQY